MNAPRIAIYGGAFDPVHLGHLLVAWAAREEAELDKMIFVPARISPFKQDRELAPFGLRAQMLRLALAGMEWCSVSELEFQRGGVSYTVDTIRSLRQEFAGARLFFLIGEDNLAGLPQWREADELVKLVEFLVIPRPGMQARPPSPGARLHRLKGWPAQISSSQIRERVRLGLPIGHLVPPMVSEVILKNQLYLG